MREIFEPPQRVPIRLFTNSIDDESERRLRRLARLDHLSGPIAVLPDVHPAGETVVGTAIVSSGVVYPILIGEDIGCGMASAQLAMAASEFDRADWLAVLSRLAKQVPAGRRGHPPGSPLPDSLQSSRLSTRSLEHDRDRVGACHFATLGEGNHFLEFQADPDDGLWVTVHSGSRGMGGAIARYHARGGTERDHGIPFFPLESEAGRNFLGDHDWALQYSFESRRAMLAVAIAALDVGTGPPILEQFDVVHNSVALEMHGDVRLAVHRKGAMPAPAGGIGVIPGSMGTASYVVEGLGAPDSWRSCSHGAGLRLSRSEARRRVSLAEFRRAMGRVVYLPDSEGALVEEAPQAYKDVGEVLRLQRELVRPRARLVPLAVLKG